MDDLLVSGANPQQHLQNVRALLQAKRRYSHALKGALAVVFDLIKVSPIPLRKKLCVSNGTQTVTYAVSPPNGTPAMAANRLAMGSHVEPVRLLSRAS